MESCDPDGNTLLHYATVLGRKDMMRLLYQRYIIMVTVNDLIVNDITINDITCNDVIILLMMLC